MEIRHGQSNGPTYRGRDTLLVCLLCGLAGVLVDTDHALSLIIWHFGARVNEGRLFHTPLFIGTGLAICGMVTYLARLHNKLILRILLALTILAVAGITAGVLIYSPLTVWEWYRE